MLDQPKHSRTLWIVGALGVLLIGGTVCLGVGVAGWWLGSRGQAGNGQGGVKAFFGGKAADEWGWQDLQDHLASKGFKTRRGQGAKGMWFAPGEGKPIDGKMHDPINPDDVNTFLSMTPKDADLLRQLEAEWSSAMTKFDVTRDGKDAKQLLAAKERAAREKLDKTRAEIEKRTAASPQQAFLARDLVSVAAARNESARLKDVDQRDSLQWGKYVFEGPPQVLAELKRLLP